MKKSNLNNMKLDFKEFGSSIKQIIRRSNNLKAMSKSLINVYKYMANNKSFLKNLRSSFIISTGRTGTKFLAKFIDEITDSKTLALHEPPPKLLKLGMDFSLSNISKEKAIKKFKIGRENIRTVLSRRDISTYVESNNRLFSLAPVIKEIFENPKFIHIVRDGRDVVRSLYSRTTYTDKDSQDIRLKATDFPNDPFYTDWKNFSRFDKLCWYWMKKDKIIQESSNHLDNYITVKFEDIFDRESNYMGAKKIIDFIFENNIDIEKHTHLFNREVKETKKYDLPHWKQWNDKKTNKFNLICGEHMERYGYM